MSLSKQSGAYEGLISESLSKKCEGIFFLIHENRCISLEIGNSNPDVIHREKYSSAEALQSNA